MEAVLVAVPLVVVLINAVVVFVERSGLEAVVDVVYLDSVGWAVYPITVTDVRGLIVKHPILLPVFSLK